MWVPYEVILPFLHLTEGTRLSIYPRFVPVLLNTSYGLTLQFVSNKLRIMRQKQVDADVDLVPSSTLTPSGSREAYGCESCRGVG